MLVDYLGEENMRNMLEEHAGAVNAMHQFKQHIGDQAWLEDHAPEVLKGLQGSFMHVTGCDGLSIIIERFSDTQKVELDEHLERVQANPQRLTQLK